MTNRSWFPKLLSKAFVLISTHIHMSKLLDFSESYFLTGETGVITLPDRVSEVTVNDVGRFLIQIWQGQR